MDKIKEAKVKVIGAYHRLHPKKYPEEIEAFAEAITALIIAVVEAEDVQAAKPPAIPEGWTPASELPFPAPKPIEIMYDDHTTERGWFGPVGSVWYRGDDIDRVEKPVLCWRELQPAAQELKVGDTVTLTGKIVEVDPGTHVPYKIDFGSGPVWLSHTASLDLRKV